MILSRIKNFDTVRYRPHAAVAVVFLVIVILPQLLSSYYTGLMVEMLIFGVFALSLNLLLGYTGLPSLGHSAFFGTAAYTTGILSLRVTENFWLDALAGLLAAMVMAVLFGLLVLRTTGAYFLMLTFALAQVVWSAAFKWRSMTGGDNGLPGIDRPDFSWLPWSMWDTTVYFYFALLISLIALVGMYYLVHSPYGLTLQGIRDNEGRMQALGYNTWLHKMVVFVIAGFFAGVGGILFAYYYGFVGNSEVSVLLSAEVFLMVILGGAGTLLGPAFGAGAVVLLRNFVSDYTGRWLLILGTIYVLVVLFAPKGVVVEAQNRTKSLLKR